MQSIAVRRRSRHVEIALRGIVDIAQAQALKEQLAKALSYGLPLQLDVRVLERLDTAAAQTLLAFGRAAQRQHLPLEIHDTAGALAGAWHRLGLPPLAEV